MTKIMIYLFGTVIFDSYVISTQGTVHEWPVVRSFAQYADPVAEMIELPPWASPAEDKQSQLCTLWQFEPIEYRYENHV